MRAVFGVVALLIVLAVIGMVAARQMKAGQVACAEHGDLLVGIEPFDLGNTDE